MSNESIKVGAATYRLGKRLSAIEQFHVTRRLGPALVLCGVTWQMIQQGIEVSLDDWVAVAGPVMDVVSKMQDDDVEKVITTCLRAVEREQGSAWAPVMSSAGQIMFEDIDQAEMVRLVLHVLRHNLSNFARGLTAGESSTEGSGAARP